MKKKVSELYYYTLEHIVGNPTSLPARQAASQPYIYSFIQSSNQPSKPTSKQQNRRHTQHKLKQQQQFSLVVVAEKEADYRHTHITSHSKVKFLSVAVILKQQSSSLQQQQQQHNNKVFTLHVIEEKKTPLLNWLTMKANDPDNQPTNMLHLQPCFPVGSQAVSQPDCHPASHPT